MSFATKLRELRLLHKMTQQQLGNAIKLSKSTISMYENGQREPEYEILEAIADTFNVDMNTLLDTTPTGQQRVPTRDWLRQLCVGNEKALAALDRLSITETGEIKLAGSDARSEAVIQHQISSLISALEKATDNGDGTKTAVWKP